MTKSNESYDKLDKKCNEEIQKLKKELKENEEYFNDYEENRIKTQEKIKELNKLNNELDIENQEIKKELNVNRLMNMKMN